MAEREVDASANLHRVRGNESESESETGNARKNERQALYIQTREVERLLHEEKRYREYSEKEKRLYRD